MPRPDIEDQELFRLWKALERLCDETVVLYAETTRLIEASRLHRAELDGVLRHNPWLPR